MGRGRRIPRTKTVKPINAFRGQPFFRVFTPGGLEGWWRVQRSGVQGPPSWSGTVTAVWTACEHLGISVERKNWAAPGFSCASYELRAAFLDGGFESMTGNYWYSPRGAWVEGARAVLLLALCLGLRVRPGWRRSYGLEDATLDSLTAELRRDLQARSKNRASDIGE